MTIGKLDFYGSSIADTVLKSIGSATPTPPPPPLEITTAILQHHVPYLILDWNMLMA